MSIKKIFLSLLFSLLFGGSLSVLFLFNLPLFYEQEKFGFLTTFLIVFIIFSLIAALSFKLLSIPLKYVKEKNKGNIVFTSLLILLFTCIFYYTSSYYWSIPKSHQIEICYQSDTRPGSLSIHAISDKATGHVYDANIFSNEKYPITIPVSTCIHGSIRTVQEWDGLRIHLGEKGEEDRATVEINRRLTSFPLVDQDVKPGSEIITASAGAGGGTPIYPYIFSSTALIFVKWAALLLSSVYLALFVFALSEIIIFQNTELIISPAAALSFVLIYFLVFGYLMVHHGGQPDQSKHMYYSTRYSETWGIPDDNSQSPFHIKGHEYLYYWINGAMAKLVHGLDADASRLTDKLVWRLMSVVMSAGTLFYIYQLTSRVTGNKFGGVLAAFFAANTLMFVFVSGGVSYDNMMNLSSAAAMYHVVCVLKKDNYVRHTALAGIWLALGSLAKDQVALLSFLLFFVWLLHTIKYGKSIRFDFSYVNFILITVLVFAISLFLGFYGGNMIKYHSLKPKCHQVKPAEACTRFSYRDKHRQEVDYEQLWTSRNEIIGPFEYALNYWLFNKINGIWGIISHNTYAPKFSTSLHGCLIIWAIFCMVRYWKRDDLISAALVAVTLGYVGYVFLFNYNNELRMGFRHYAVQGRYLFPVFGAFLALMVGSFLNIRSALLKRISLSLALILYFAGGLGTFIFRYSDVFITWRIFY
jgi:hypothetical protein